MVLCGNEGIKKMFKPYNSIIIYVCIRISSELTNVSANN